MKTFQCSCSRTKEVEDNIIMVICEHCQEAMKEIKGDKNESKRETN